MTPRAKREAQRRERPGVPSLRAGALGARRVALEPRRRGAVGAGQPARTGGGEAPWGMPASCRWGDGGRGRGGEGMAWRGRQGSPVDGRSLDRGRFSTHSNFSTHPNLTSWRGARRGPPPPGARGAAGGEQPRRGIRGHRSPSTSIYSEVRSEDQIYILGDGGVPLESSPPWFPPKIYIDHDGPRLGLGPPRAGPGTLWEALNGGHRRGRVPGGRPGARRAVFDTLKFFDTPKSDPFAVGHFSTHPNLTSWRGPPASPAPGGPCALLRPRTQSTRGTPPRRSVGSAPPATTRVWRRDWVGGHVKMGEF